VRQDEIGAAADRVAALLKETLDGDPRIRHELLGDFALVRNWAELGLREFDGEFDLMTADGLLNHIAHLEDEVKDAVLAGLEAWRKAAQDRAVADWRSLEDERARERLGEDEYEYLLEERRRERAGEEEEEES
jgi:hypothetical protein